MFLTNSGMFGLKVILVMWLPPVIVLDGGYVPGQSVQSYHVC